MQRYYTNFHHMALGAIGFALCLAMPAKAETVPASAVIFAYQRVGDESVSPGGISLDSFRAHLRELQSGGYNVVPLADIVKIAGKSDAKPLPPRTVAITFDGAWTATLDNALPLLDAAKLPYTVFFSPDMVENSENGYADYARIKTLRKNRRVSLGLLPGAYLRMTKSSDEANAALINKSVVRYRDLTNREPEFFAYPYGEYSTAIRDRVTKYTFKGAFGQQSGVVHAGSDRFALPRFSITDSFDDIDRFRLTANALPLPVSDVTPDDPLVHQNPPQIGFTVAQDIRNLSGLSCFVSGIGKAPLARLGSNRFEIRLAEPLQDRRTRVNCTLPVTSSDDDMPVWRWFGMLFVTDIEDDAGVEPEPENTSPVSE